VSVFIRNL